MATAILNSIKHGAYTAIALYVVFIAVVTVISTNPQLNPPSQMSTQTASVELNRAAVQSQGRAS
jgi:Na+/H+ antiporter NhaC